jgi:hypothetical protein
MSFQSLVAVGLGYVGAVGIVLFGARSAHAALFRGRAGMLNPLDFGILTIAGICLTGYAISSGDAIFTLTNLVSASCNGVVAMLALRAKRLASDRNDPR